MCSDLVSAWASATHYQFSFKLLKYNVHIVIYFNHNAGVTRCFELTTADTMLLWKMYSIQNELSYAFCLQHSSYAHLLLDKVSSLVPNGVHRFSMLSLPAFKFSLFFTLLSKYFYWIQLHDSFKTENISAESPFLVAVVAIYRVLYICI